MKKIKAFDIGGNIFLILYSAFVILPLLLLVSSSFTDDMTLVRSGYNFFPKKFSIDAYTYMLTSRGKILHAYWMSFVVTGIGTACSLAMTTTLGYMLSKPRLHGHRFLTLFVFFTMLFNGGLIPTYLMYTNYFQIKNTLIALIVPNLLVRAYYVMLMKSYFQTNLPSEVLEAAKVDGASEFQIFTQVAIPMSKPIIATVFMFTLIMYWNDWQNGLYYLTTRTGLYTIQNLLNRMIQEIQFLTTSAEIAANSLVNFPSTTVRMAIAVIGILPIAILYPFVQRNFEKGITLGAVKG